MPDADSTAAFSRLTIAEGIVGIVMLGLAFAAIAASDVSSTGTHLYWTVLTVAFALAAFAADRLHTDHNMTDLASGLRILLHWFGVFVAVQLVYLLVSTGRMANADTGLSNGLILALGTFLAGVHGNWRLMVIGAALALATAGIAYVEQYLWVLLAIAIAAIATLLVGSRLTGRHMHGSRGRP